MAGHDDGAIAIIVALLAVALFGFGALVIDIGNAESVRGSAQGAIDAGSLAGVQCLEAVALAAAPTQPPPPAFVPTTVCSAPEGGSLGVAVYSAVTSIVKKNIDVTDAEWADTTLCTDGSPLPEQTSSACISFAQPGDADPTGPGGKAYTSYEVRVQFPIRKVTTTFGGLFGVSSIKVAPVSVSQAGQPPPSACAACSPTLDDEGHPTSRVVIPRSVQNELYALHLTPQTWVAGSCPAPGEYDSQDLVLGDCALASGSYFFENSTVTVNGNLTLASSNPLDSTTLVFGGIGTLVVDPGGSLTLDPAPASSSPVSSPTPTPTPTPTSAPTITPPGSPPASGAPTSSPAGTAPVSSPPVSSVPASSPASSPPPQEGLPGVSIVFEGHRSQPVTFDLGDHFSITGTVYAPNATWQVRAPECTSTPDCVITSGTLSVGHTDFEAGSTPTVDVVMPLVTGSPSASVEPHLVR